MYIVWKTWFATAHFAPSRSHYEFARDTAAESTLQAIPTPEAAHSGTSQIDDDTTSASSLAVSGASMPASGVAVSGTSGLATPASMPPPSNAPEPSTPGSSAPMDPSGTSVNAPAASRDPQQPGNPGSKISETRNPRPTSFDSVAPFSQSLQSRIEEVSHEIIDSIPVIRTWLERRRGIPRHILRKLTSLEKTTNDLFPNIDVEPSTVKNSQCKNSRHDALECMIGNLISVKRHFEARQYDKMNDYLHRLEDLAKKFRDGESHEPRKGHPGWQTICADGTRPNPSAADSDHTAVSTYSPSQTSASPQIPASEAPSAAASENGSLESQVTSIEAKSTGGPHQPTGRDDTELPQESQGINDMPADASGTAQV